MRSGGFLNLFDIWVDCGDLRGCPSPPRAYPCVLAALARVPFRWSERGRWIPAFAGMTGEGDSGVVLPVRPGHPPAVLLRSPASPLRCAKGDRVDSCVRRNDGGARG